MPAGRPTDYTLELAAKICERLAAGESLKSISKDEDMPHRASVYLWLVKHPEFSDMYTRAKEDAADAMADDILEIADDGSNDWMANHDPDNPGWKANGEHINRSRLRVDARKWIAAKLKPRKYGDSTSVVHSGSVTLEELITGARVERVPAGQRAN